MKARIRRSETILDYNYEDLEKAEKSMIDTWEEFRNELIEPDFKYDDIEKAKKIKFLRAFDNLFNYSGKENMICTLSSIERKYFIGRGTKLTDENSLTYSRFMPVSEYLKNDNRFSPPEVEWIYLSLGNSKFMSKCGAERECRAEVKDRFGFCRFKVKDEYPDLKIVDLTLADKDSYQDIVDRLENALYKKKEKAIHDVLRAGFRRNIYSNKDFKTEAPAKEWQLYTYLKMLSLNIFVPLETEDKSIVYRPFQTIAKYFESLGYSGIVYSSTVFEHSKNLVLFNKDFVYPSGELLDYKIEKI